MGERLSRVASFLGFPWIPEPEWLPDPDEDVLARFSGLWTIVYVTRNWIMIRSPPVTSP